MLHRFGRRASQRHRWGGSGAKRSDPPGHYGHCDPGHLVFSESIKQFSPAENRWLVVKVYPGQRPDELGQLSRPDAPLGRQEPPRGPQVRAEVVIVDGSYDMLGAE